MSEDATRGWGWAAHLRSGGRTPWAEWHEIADMDRPPGGVRHLPGAEVLELLRRLNAAGPVSEDLTERVLTTTAPGRGRRDLPLRDDTRPRSYGVAPVEPAALQPRELLRVAGRLLAEDAIADHHPDPVRRHRLLSRARRIPARLSRRRPVEDPRRPFRLAGDPWVTIPLREELARQGRHEGGPGSTVYVIGRPLDELAADAWTTRSFTGRVNPWPIWLRDARWRGRLGPRADVLRAARRWAERVGPERVQVVTDLSLLPGLLEIDTLPQLWELSAEAVEVARVTGQALCTMVPPEVQPPILRQILRPRLEKAEPLVPGGRVLGVPEEYHDFVDAQARAQRDGLLEDRYSFHGDPDLLLPSGASTSGPEGERALGLALALLAGR